MTEAKSDSYLTEWGLEESDDAFHPRTDDPWWTETAWYAWYVPERNLVGYFYPVFRHNKGVQAGGVLVYDHTADLPWEILHFDYDWHADLDPELDLRDAKLDNSMTLKVTKPCHSFELGYDHKELSFRFDVEAVTKPLVTRSSPPFNKGHIDQLCRVSGQMVLRGETIEVDCIAMRDRSWGPREDGRQPQVGYAYGCKDADNAFLAVAVYDWKKDEYPITTGFLIRDGEWQKVVSGSRRVERDGEGKPTVVHMEGKDEAGRTFTARGELRSRQVFTSYPSMFCWNGLVEWEVDGWTGFGEDQDVWHPRRWRDFVAKLRSS